MFIQDTSQTDGRGLTGLVYNSASLTVYYIRQGDASATAITLVTATVGTWVSGGFKEIDATNMPGWYELHVPNAAIASGAKSVGIHLKGATNMAPYPIELELDAVNYQDAVRLGLSALPNAAAGANGGLPLGDASGRVDLGLWLGSAPDALSSGKIPADLKLWLATAPLALSSQQVQAIVSAYGSGLTPLQPTVAGRTLDVTATGEAGLDFDNIKDATGAHTLTNITVPTVATLTGHTPQTGDNYAKLGTPAGVSVSADIAAVKAQTAAIETDTQDLQTKVGTPAGASVSADVAAVKSETASLLARLGAWTGTGINTVLGAFRAISGKAAALTPTDMSTGTTFDNTSDSLEALKDQLPAATEAAIAAIHGNGAYGAAGATGAHTVTITVVDDTTSAVLSSALVTVKSALGATYDQGRTDEDGIFTTSADDGNFTVSVNPLPGYSAVTDQAFVVNGDEAVEVRLAEIAADAVAAGTRIVRVITINGSGTVVAGVTVTAKLADGLNTINNAFILPTVLSATSDANGVADLTLITSDQFEDGSGEYTIAWSDQEERVTVAAGATPLNLQAYLQSL